MLGRGGTLLEGIRLQPLASFIGVDNAIKQLDSARSNICGRPIELMEGSATRLPLKMSSVDAIVCDLPFGIRHGNAVQNCVLYPRVLAEMKRVLKPQGIAVILSLDRKILNQAVHEDCDWFPISRSQIYLGNIKL